MDGDSYVWWLVFLRLGVRGSYVWRLVFLPLMVIRFLRLELENITFEGWFSYVWKLGIFSFRG